MSDALRTVVVTGLGQCSSLGVGIESFWTALTAAASGLRPVEGLGPAGPALAAPLSLSAELTPDERLPAALRLALLEALQDAGWDEAARATATVVAASNFGDSLGYPEHRDFMRPLRRVLCELGFEGEYWALSTACASGAGALGLASDLVRHAGAERAVVCAYDAITPYNYGGLLALRAISAETIRPFDKRRSGTLLGEAAVALVLESGESHSARRPYAEVLGYGISNDAYHFTAPEPEGVGVRAAMRQALDQAGLEVHEIDHLNAHGTGTPHNDAIETRAFKTLFGAAAARVPITSIKAAVGHTMGAAGALECLATILSLRDGIVPPTLNFQEPDPACDLDYVFNHARPVTLRTAASNSYGLWGANACVLLRRCDPSGVESTHHDRG